MNVLRSDQNTDAGHDSGRVWIGFFDGESRLFRTSHVQSGRIQSMLKLCEVVHVKEVITTKPDIVHQCAILSVFSANEPLPERRVEQHVRLVGSFDEQAFRHFDPLQEIITSLASSAFTEL